MRLFGIGPMASGSAQDLCCEPRQTRNRATVAITICVAVKSEASSFFDNGTDPVYDFLNSAISRIIFLASQIELRFLNLSFHQLLKYEICN